MAASEMTKKKHPLMKEAEKKMKKKGVDIEKAKKTPAKGSFFKSKG